MKKIFLYLAAGVLTIAMFSFVLKPKPVKIFLIGDSTVADYSLEEGYMQKKYPITGWGQVFQPFFTRDSLKQLRTLIKSDSVLVVDKAKGGRSTKSFFNEGRWKEVLASLEKNDLVLIQFGHNDGAKDKPERYIDVAGYKDFLRMYVNETRSKGAKPILLTPVARNSPWKDGKLNNSHTDYPQGVIDVANELKVPLIDLNALSMAFLTSKGKEFSARNYFMNLDSAKYEAYPKGNKDNTHFQPAGAKEMAKLVYEGLKKISNKN
ncbi:rhamnogalacturonan acetylesterase [Pedobacter sp. AW1-32]|uniref:rhamnogalacturonan acetylesterase n=1 Tax=Pedobacter sp. AW1-32 TaxID=3383026 RepID=UPI003FEF4629